SLTAALLLAALPCPTFAWFGNSLPPTISMQINSAQVIAYGTLRRATPANPRHSGEQVTDLIVDGFIKLHPLAVGKKTIILNSFIPGEGRQYLCFCGINEGKLILHQAVILKKGSDLPKYVEKLHRLQNDAVGKRMRFYFDHLRHPEQEIAD